jgi:hypothetical protein
MGRCVEYKGYEIDVGISDVSGVGVIAIIRPIADAAAEVDARARVTAKDNMISLQIEAARVSGERDESALMDLGLRAATIEIEVRLADHTVKTV